MLSLIPGSKNLIGANIELVSQNRREYRLREALEPIRSKYPFILLDCPPALDLLTLNSLVAADGLLVPMQAEYFALEGISELMSTLDRVAQAFNPDLALEGVLLTMYDDRTNLSQQVTDNLRGFFGSKLLKTTIPRNIRLAEAPSHGLPVALYDPRSRGAEAYRELALEILTRNKIESPEQKKRQAAAPLQSARSSPLLHPKRSPVSGPTPNKFTHSYIFAGPHTTFATHKTTTCPQKGASTCHNHSTPPKIPSAEPSAKASNPCFPVARPRR